MKYFWTIFFLIALTNMNAQQYDFEKKWNFIQTKLEKEKDYKSVIPLLEEYKDQALKAGNTQEYVRSLYMGNLFVIMTSDGDEYSDVTSEWIEKSLKEEDNAQGITKDWLMYYNAMMLSQYQNRSYYYDYGNENTAQVEENDEDIETWSYQKLTDEIQSRFEYLRKDEPRLIKEKLEAWPKLFEEYENVELTPTLFHYFMVSYLDWMDQPGYEQEDEKLNDFGGITKEVYIAVLRESARNNWNDAYAYFKEKEDTNSGLSFNEKMRSLQNLINDAIVQKSDYKTQIEYQLAQNYYNSNLLDKTHHFCDSILSSEKKNKWSVNLENLKTRLEQKEAQCTFPSINNPNFEIPVDVMHYQTDDVYLRIYDITSKEGKFYNIDKIQYWDNKNDKLNFNAPLIISKKLPVKTFNDFQRHETLMVLESLPKGTYQYFISNRENFQIKDTIRDFLNGSSFLVTPYFFNSKINLINDKGEDRIYSVHVQVVENENGSPVINEKIKLYDIKNQILIATGRTDNNGFLKTEVKISRNNNYSNIKGVQVGEIDQNIYPLQNPSYYYRWNEPDSGEEEKWNAQSDIFLDRSIYRPGQKVYYKALLFETLKSNRRVLANKKIDLTVLDANFQPIYNFSLTTNDFGSVAGSFDLPDSGVLGNYTLEVVYNSSTLTYGSLQVEEYKRPKFEVDFNEVKENFSLKDSVQISGFAKSFAGSNITDAKVSYRIFRQEYAPYPFFKGGRCYFPSYYSVPEFIDSGETYTDANGNFTINFFPTAPVNENGNSGPRAFSYEISVEVVDINGEMHEGTTAVRVGDIPKVLEISAPDKIASSELKDISIESTNLNDQKVAGKGTFEIIKLIDPENRIITNYFPTNSDYQSVSENDLENKFPHWSFKDDSNYKEFELGETVYKSSFSNPEYDEKNKDWGVVDIPTLAKGYYLIQALELYGKDSIRAFQYVQIMDDDNRTINNHTLLNAFVNKEKYNVGEEAIIQFYTDAESLELFYAINFDGSDKEIKKLVLHKGLNSIKINITETMSYGLYVDYFTTKWQTTKKSQLFIPVLQKDNKLNITNKVFRDKIKPGVPEKWQFVISGKDKDKINAEVLATMYDASLDMIVPHSLSFNLNPYRYLDSAFYEWYFGSLSFKNSYSVYYPNSNFQYQNENLSTVWTYNDIYIQDKRRYISEAIVLGRGLEDDYQSSGAYKELAISRVVDVRSDSDGLEEMLNAGIAPTAEDSMDYTDPYFNPAEKKDKIDLGDVPIRKNLQETAFFFPQLRTNENGDIILEFTSPEALTKWKLQLLAHTKDMKTGSETLFTQTQKELMVIPNPPRFLREGDEISFSTKIANMSQENLNGDCTLQIFNAANMNPVDELFGNSDNVQSFKVDKGGNTSATWKLKIPKDIPAIVYRVIAKTATFSDGEENSLPILTNRQLVTETIPIFVREGQNKTYEFEKLKDNTSATLDNHLLKLELNTNPTWMAIFALPYLMDFPYECSEQLFNRYYANSIAQEVMTQNPDFQRVMDVYADSDVSTSKLLQNQEVKNIAIENSPWLKDALSQEEQMKMLAEHFQKGKLEKELKKTSRKFWNRQMQSGGFAWFDGGKESKYISEYILAGFGKLKKMNADNNDEDYQNNIYRLIDYCDAEMMREIREAQKAKKPYIPYAFNYLYARSFWTDEVPIEQDLNAYIEKLIKNSESDYAFTNLQEQAQYALILQRFGKTEEAKKRLHFIEETSVDSEKNGMYWKANTNGFGWYEKPVETQAAIIEAFQEISPEKVEDIESMKVWLIGQKQNQHWSTSKSTSEAIYAFLNSGKSWSNSEEGINIQSQFVIPDNDLTKAGSIESTINGENITQNSSHLEISKTSPGVAMGGMYWQYFENLENITASSSGLVIKKELFLKVNTEQGPKLQTIDESYPIKVGDKVTTRLTISSSKDVEFIHLKDMRASGFEPGNILSQYYYENGLSYYLNSRDASTDFFFDYIKKGIYVLEYEVIANNAGTFSNGIATLQSMYAPELAAHSEGISVVIED